MRDVGCSCQNCDYYFGPSMNYRALPPCPRCGSEYVAVCAANILIDQRAFEPRKSYVGIFFKALFGTLGCVISIIGKLVCAVILLVFFITKLGNKT